MAGSMKVCLPFTSLRRKPSATVYHMKITAFLLIALASFLHAEPTESREWQATSGHKTEARALSATATSVMLELTSGKTVTLPLDKLVPTDRETILTHFKIEPPKLGDPVRSGDTPLPGAGLDYAIGEITGNVESAPGSHFHIYLPKTLKKGRPAPVLHFNNAGAVQPAGLNPYIPACERFGWILVGSAESKNGLAAGANLGFATANIKMLRENPLVDPERIYFTGNSGGGAQSWENCAALKGAGTMPNIGYIPHEVKITKGRHFITGGARDYNRYLSAQAASRFPKDAVYRAFPGGHSGVSEKWITEEGIAWLTAKYLSEKSKDPAFAGQRLDFEAAVIDWMTELSGDMPHLAYHIGMMMQDIYGVSGNNGKIIAGKVTELAKDTQNLRFSAGLEAIHDFGIKSMADEGSGGGSAFNSSVPAISRKAAALAGEYAGVKFVEKTFKELSESTVGK